MKDKNRGILCIILSSCSFALIAMFLKMAGDLPSIEKSFFRNLVASVIAFVMLIRSKEKIQIQKRNLHWFILRSLFGTLGIFCNFYAVDHLMLSDASSLNKLSPFFVIVFSTEREDYTDTVCLRYCSICRKLIYCETKFCDWSNTSSGHWFCRRNVCRFCIHLCKKTRTSRRERSNDRIFLLNIFHACMCSISDR